ncbi:mitochondrial carrier domain-containing protein, partial [Parasitella parasitica]
MAIDSFYLAASSVAALVARFVTYPLDTIKTRIQTQSEERQCTLPIDSDQQKPTVPWFKYIQSLYKGICITLLFSVPALTVYLCCYELAKDFLATSSSVGCLQRNALLNHAISGCFAEISAGIFFTPMEVIKSRLQILTDADRGTTTISLIKDVAREEGFSGFYRGYWITVAVFLPHTVTYFVVYEQLKGLWTVEEQTFLVYLLCSGIASTLGIIVSTPLDIIKTRWQVSAQEHAYRGGPIKIAQLMWQNEGKFRAFTKGLLVRIAWGIPVTTINMTVFE